MKQTPVWIDCDVGVDDALALLMACKMDDVKLVGVSSVAGNVEVEKTTVNALRVLELAGSDAPVYRGAAVPLLRNQVTATYVHGQNGLNDLDLPMPKRQAEAEKAHDALYAAAKAYAGELIVIAIGPLTNLGLALAKYKDLPKLVKKIVVMGGAAVGGNVTPAAEFNIFADPEAADMVFTSGVTVHMCGLDVTMKAYFTPAEIDELGALGSKQARFARDVTQGVLRYSLSLGLCGMCMHDPVTLVYALDDSLFSFDEAGVRVETKGKITYGKTVTDLYSDKQFPVHNAVVVTDVNREAFKARVFELMGKY